jgi:hypothetical protein
MNDVQSLEHENGPVRLYFAKADNRHEPIIGLGADSQCSQKASKRPGTSSTPFAAPHEAGANLPLEQAVEFALFN